MGTKSVLIMDDGAYIRRLLVDMLLEISAITMFFQAANTVSAEKIIREEQPSIAVLDINMSDGVGQANGIDILKLAKAVNPHMLVIMLTNHANERYRIECQQAGADFFFDKSTEFDLLPGTIESWLQNDHSQSLIEPN